MGRLKRRTLELQGARPVQMKRTYNLAAPIGVPAFDRALHAFAASVSSYWSTNTDELLFSDKWRGMIRRWWRVTDVDGTFSCESLDQLRDHLRRRRVERFEIKADYRADARVLVVRSNGRSVDVVSQAWTRHKALELFEPIVGALGLVSPGVGDPSRVPAGTSMRFDAFIAHASEDKAAVALPLQRSLKSHGYDAWLDRLRLRVGDSLREEIDKGLARSRHGIVILSPSFFRKTWPRRELDALFTQEAVVRKRMILPVLYRMTHAQLSKRSPLLAARLAASMADGLETVVGELIASMGAPLKKRRPGATTKRRKRSSV